MLRDRQKKILKLVVDNYVKTAQAVSSELLAKNLQVSSATIRNDMADMTEQGYLMQPHTSAGRIPAEAGWQYYVEHFVAGKNHTKKFAELDSVTRPDDMREYSKALAKKVVALADAAVMIAYAPRDLYYTGLTNLFSQPEFHELQSVVSVTQVIDHLDEVMVNVFDDITAAQILIGEANPFSPECSVVIDIFEQTDNKGIFAIMGPMRMNYTGNISLLQYAATLLQG